MEEKSPAKLAAERAVSVLGGQTRAAKALGLRNYQTLQFWLKNRVPAEYCPLIERETAKTGNVVRCEELRPDVEWSVLRRPARKAA